MFNNENFNKKRQEILNNKNIKFYNENTCRTLLKKCKVNIDNLERILITNNHKRLYLSLIHIFKNCSFPEIYYIIKNNLNKNIPKQCENCNKKAIFINSKQGYKPFCSETCRITLLKKNRAKKISYYTKNNIKKIDINFIKKMVKTVDSRSFYHYILKNNPEQLSAIINKTGFLPKTCKFNERIYNVYYNIKDSVKCDNCMAPAKFRTFTIGYKPCSYSCGAIVKNNKHKNTETKRLNNYELWSSRLKLKNINILNDKNDFINTGILNLRCDTCNYIYKRNIRFGINCPSCNKKGISKAKEEIINWLETNGIKIKKNTRKVIPPLELDIFCEDKKIAIEYNGLYWHSELNGKGRNYHLNKTKLCEKNGIQLIHIFENEWEHKKDLIHSMLLNKLGLINTKIYARNCIIKNVSKEDKRQFLNNNHIQGNDKSSIYYGLYYNNKLVSLMTFGKRKITGSCINIELLRFCTLKNIIVVGGANKLFNHYIKNNKVNKIITYADRRWSNGNLYYILGFKLDHISSPNYWYLNNYDRLTIKHRSGFQKHTLKKRLQNFNPTLSEWENMKNNNFDRIWDCGNYVFVYEK